MDDLRDKVSDKETNISLNVDDVEVELPYSGRKGRLGGNVKLEGLRIGWGRKKEKKGG